MQPQEIFNKSFLAVLEQGHSCTDGSSCYYIMENAAGEETCCAVGHLLTKEQARAWMKECLGDIDDVIRRMRRIEVGTATPVIGCEPWIIRHRALLADIQKAHDGLQQCEGVEWRKGWIEEMRVIAAHYELTMPEFERQEGDPA